MSRYPTEEERVSLRAVVTTFPGTELVTVINHGSPLWNQIESYAKATGCRNHKLISWALGVDRKAVTQTINRHRRKWEGSFANKGAEAAVEGAMR
jgi:hypothetical protein